MAISGGTGIGSGLDIAGITRALVAADRAPTDTRLNRLESASRFTLTALGNVSSAFDKLKTAIDALAKPGALAARSVSVTDNTIVGATAANGASAGTYSITVEQLASANKLVTAGLAADTLLGGGTFKVFVGAKSVDVTIAAENSTPAKVQEAIQAATRGIGAQASLIKSDAGTHIALTADQAGAATAIRIEMGAGSSTALANALGGAVQQVPAQDARVRVDGLVRTVAGNSVDDLVAGVSFTFKALGTTSVAVTGDASGSRKAMQDVVTAYNATVNAMATATRYNAETKVPSALTGDAQMRGASADLRNVLAGVLGDAAASGLDAATLGMTTKVDGTLEFDTAKFDAALAASPGKLEAVLIGDNGLSGKLSKVLGSYVGTDGAFAMRTKGLNDRLKDAADQRSALDARMELAAARYKKQFVALDSLVAQLSSTGNYLAQQLSLFSK